MKSLGYFKKYIKYLLLTILSAVALIFISPLVPSLMAASSGHSPSNAYIFFGLFMIGLTANFYYYVFLSPLILLITERFSFSKKLKVLLPSLALIFLFASIYVANFCFHYMLAQFSDSGKAQIQLAQFLDKENKKKIADEFCSNIKGKLDIQRESLEKAITQIDEISRSSGLKLATEYVYIRSGYIAYYFKPTSADDIESAKEKAIAAFKKNKIGPTQYWLNIDWYNNYIKDSSDLDMRQLIDIQNGLIEIRYETLFPLLDDFVSQGILKNPPPHVLKAAKKAGLEFVRSERLDFISYSYSIPVPFFQFLGQYFNLHYILAGTRSTEGYKQVSLRDVKCLWPKHDFKGSRPGTPPSNKITYPPTPFEIPSCHEYATWLHCQRGKNSDTCDRDEFKKGAPAPTCKLPEVLFTKEKYG